MRSPFELHFDNFSNPKEVGPLYYCPDQCPNPWVGCSKACRGISHHNRRLTWSPGNRVSARFYPTGRGWPCIHHLPQDAAHQQGKEGSPEPGSQCHLNPKSSTTPSCNPYAITGPMPVGAWARMTGPHRASLRPLPRGPGRPCGPLAPGAMPMDGAASTWGG